MTVRIFNPAGVPKPVGTYSHLAVAEGNAKLLVLAGQIGQRPDSSFPETVEEQFEQALENIFVILASEGGDAAAIMRLTMFLTERPAVPGSIGILVKRYFVVPPPTTAVYVVSLYAPQVKIEIEAIAAV